MVPCENALGDKPKRSDAARVRFYMRWALSSLIISPVKPDQPGRGFTLILAPSLGTVYRAKLLRSGTGN